MRTVSLASLIALFISGNFASANDRLSCTALGGERFEAIEETTADVRKVLIVGNYSDKVFRQTCKLEWIETIPATKTKPEEKFKNTCSSTLIGDRRLLTGAHCDLKPGAVATCSCGIDPNTKKEVLTQSKVQPQSSANDKYDPLDVGTDIRIAHLSSAPNCPKPLSPITPAKFPKSLDHAKQLLNDRNCYFAGFGLDNTRKSGGYHSVTTPLFFTFDNDETPQWISYYNDKKVEVTAAALKKHEAAMTKARKTKAEIKKVVSEATDYIETTKSLIKNDKNKANATTEGDSGGSLYCIDTDGTEYLVGMPVTADQSAILVNHPTVLEWLKKHP